jgi:hypothetical protein
MTTTGRTTRRIITAAAIAAVSIPAFIAVSAPANAATTATTKLLQSMAAEEKLDIADLDKALATKPAADITFVLKSLRAGSVRHLANFQRFA